MFMTQLSMVRLAVKPMEVATSSLPWSMKERSEGSRWERLNRKLIIDKMHNKSVGGDRQPLFVSR